MPIEIIFCFPSAKISSVAERKDLYKILESKRIRYSITQKKLREREKVKKNNKNNKNMLKEGTRNSVTQYNHNSLKFKGTVRSL